MKKILQASLSAVLVLSLVGCGSTKDEAIYQDSIDAYVNEIDMDYAYDFTKTLSTDTSLHDNSLGFRTSGSDAEHRTANYLAKEMKAIGLKNVEKIPVNVDKWKYNDASLTIEGTDIDLMPVSYMVNGTDENGITAQIVDCGTGFAKDYEDKDVEGKIALVGVDQFNESWIGGYIYEAYEHGVKALVTYDLDGYGRFSDDDHQIQDVCAEDIMPTTIITMSEYKQIKKALKQGHDMATLKVDSVMEEGNGTSYDVVGYIPGKSHDQQIIFAGHYDMYFTGFQDDCSAIGTIMSMAKTMIDSGYVPENDIVVVAHGAEEWGATGTEFDWTRGAYELINNVHPEWANKTLALFNFELDAYDDGSDTFMVTCVPEYASLVKSLVDSGALNGAVKEYKNGISTKTYDTTTMEDGVSYRLAGVPYFVNVPGTSEGEKGWIQMHYHTKSDNPSTYSREVMTTNINTYGMLAIWLDQAPVMKLDLTAAVDDLNVLNEDIAKKAGIDVSQYNQSLNSLKKATVKVNKKIENINKRFANAKTEKEKDALRKEGRELNLKLHEAFKYIQDHFIGIELSSTITTSFAQYQENIELFNDIIQALEKGNISNDKDGALDLAWHINGGSEYGFYDFSVESNLRAQRRLSEETNPNNVFWTTNRQFKFAKTYPALLGIFEKAEQENPDFADEINIYQEEIKNQEVYLNEEVTQVIQAMNELTNKLLEY